MSSNKLYIKLATKDDSKDILLWRNDPTTLLYTPSNKKITRAEHDSWFSKKLKCQDSDILIIFKESSKVGMIRFDYFKDYSEISINLNPEFRGNNLSSLSIEKGIDFIKSLGIPAKPIIAKIKSNNIASIKSFEKSGFNRIELREALAEIIENPQSGWLYYVFDYLS